MTAGVDVIGGLLRGHAPLVAIVPVARIKAGALPEDIALPALLVRCISSIEQQVLKRRPRTRTRDRIAVTVRAASYREQRQVMLMVKQACAGVTGTIGDADNASVLTAGLGPDVRGPANSFEQTQDFSVSYNAL